MFLKIREGEASAHFLSKLRVCQKRAHTTQEQEREDGESRAQFSCKDD